MHINFEKLQEDKKKRIIDASIKEFSMGGYDKASTNNIVKEADISKGALFGYFGNKRELYLYILDYAIEYYLNYMKKKMQVNNPDFFQRILDWAEMKISISTEEPATYDFFAAAFFNVPEILKTDIQVRYKKLYEKGYQLSIDGIDLSKFRDDIDKQKAIELIMLSLNGILDKKIESYKVTDDNGYSHRCESFQELEEYVNILKKVFYK